MWVLPLIAMTTCIALALRRTEWADISLRISRWIYGIGFPLSLLYFPIKSGFRFQPVQCEWTFSLSLALYSLKNFQHLVMFAIFFPVTFAQFRNTKRAMAWSFAICLAMGFLVEIAQGVTAIHHCRMRDLIPDMAGAALGALAVVVTRRALAFRFREA